MKLLRQGDLDWPDQGAIAHTDDDRGLADLVRWIDKAVSFAESKKIEPSVLLISAGMIVGLILGVIIIGFLIWWFLLNGGGLGARLVGCAGRVLRVGGNREESDEEVVDDVLLPHDALLYFLAQALERGGHSARAAVGAYDGRLPSTFSVAPAGSGSTSRRSASASGWCWPRSTT